MHRQVWIAILLLLSCGLLYGQAPASTETQSKSKPSAANKDNDKLFVAKAAQGGEAEVELGKLAVEKAAHPDVKQFGQRMVDDHSKANERLKSVAMQQNYQVPSGMNAKDKALVRRLSKLSGAAFDTAYIKHMVSDHRADVAEFQKESQSGRNDEVKSFASQTLPTLQEHLKQAEEIAGKLGGTASQKPSSANPLSLTQ